MNIQPKLGEAKDINISLTQDQLHDFERDIFEKTQEVYAFDQSTDIITIENLSIILKRYFGI